MDVHRYRVFPGTAVRLAERDPREPPRFDGGKTEGREELEKLNRRLEDLHELLYAEGRHRVLFVIQAMDTGGKDGTIRRVFEGVNPQGVLVASFKKPSSLELAHDYLWRVHRKTPARGQIVIFNRSHYEDVLVVRVRSLVPEPVWSRRYDHINAFEKMLADEGTTILKLFLHISKEEQKEQLEARRREPHKQWKFSKGDVEERKLWDRYTEAYETVLSRTSTEWAPWHVIPADRKWYRNLIVSRIVIEALEGLDMRYPEPEEGFEDVVIS